MPQILTIPFHAFKLHLPDGEEVAFPLSDANAVHLKKPIGLLAKKYSKRFQKKLLDKGQFSRILDELQGGGFVHKTLAVSFPADKEGIRFPAFQLEFDYFHQAVDQRFWALLPALGLEAMAGTAEEMEERLREAVKMDFTSKKRLAFVQHIVSSIWFDAVSLERTNIGLTFYSPSELAEVQKEEKQQLLPKVATKLVVKKTEAYGRREEMRHLERILDSNFSKNILLVGASGTGKTALVWELAHRRWKQKKPNHIWETTASVLIKELTMQSGWQDNLSLLVKELTLNGDFLFVRNLAELFEVGQYAGNEVSMAEYLRPYISRGELTLISECTKEERARIELRSPNYLSFFQVVRLEEPKKGLEAIIRQKVLDIAGAKKVELAAGAIEEVIRLHRRFSPYSGMPGKPIRFLESILFAQAPSLPAGKTQKRGKVGQPAPKEEVQKTQIGRAAVLRQFSNESGMPLFMIEPDMPMEVAEVKSRFNKNVFGQKKAVDTVVDMLAAVKTALTRTGKPIASFLFVGPTGVGKTELAKVLSDFMFGSRERLLRFDMSEFSDPLSVMRLTGQGYFSDGLLTSAVRREPFCVLLFDEIEKADPSFYDLLLQILGEGRLSDSQGKLVNFCSAIIVMTSNIGAARMQAGRIGWKKEPGAGEVAGHFIKAVEKNFKPELFNRIDSVVAFEPLSKEVVRQVVEREIGLFKAREGIRFRRLEFNIGDGVLDYLADKGYNARYGARYLQRAIREELIIPTAIALNQYDHDDQLVINAVFENNKIELQTSSDPLAFELLMEQWDKLTLADQTSNLRRKMMLLLEGPLFVRMQSEIDIMEGERDVDDEKFWEDLDRSAQYSNFLVAKEKSAALYEEIKKFEIEIALATLEQGTFDAGYEERLARWEASFLELKLLIYSLLYPENNLCFLSVYGTAPQAVFLFYLKILEKKGFAVRWAQAIWYREGFNGIDNDNPYHLEEEKVPGPYVKRLFQVEGFTCPDLWPPQPGDRLYGIEACLDGEAIALYLGNEPGNQQWATGTAETLVSLHVNTSNAFQPTPEGIRRQQFYQKPKPRRTVFQLELKDSHYGIQTQVKPKDLTSFFVDLLDKRFWKVLEEIFL
ncbi:MAG TPA: ATP-dependent Clp protease ATP-binding subunit [Bacteroidetes bacterium]|nr:ATP-dependent Clp protease ATP-binding subunit [Bacteroidota bacterium]